MKKDKIRIIKIYGTESVEIEEIDKEIQKVIDKENAVPNCTVELHSHLVTILGSYILITLHFKISQIN